ncbi:hypothetical protein [Burkholderia cenocepacia]|uniref:hypothetical protein n=1 Tax=Burkholderia cenocepacia TaxID=95486 RepID=UPI000F5A5D2F|nr:hypothetical protein [Burkholderia cenocepacia]MBR8512382.1 hypothetical protein [Burkholderia cenocepacia]RQV56481.1 hypothetical protein DF020_17160 [Burkholderia cenocepacia]
MKRKRFSIEQIVAVLKQAEAGMPVAGLIVFLDLAQRHGQRTNLNQRPTTYHALLMLSPCQEMTFLFGSFDFGASDG